MKTRAGWSVLFAVLIVGLLSWWSASLEGQSWLKVVVFVGAAVVAAFAPSFVDWALRPSPPKPDDPPPPQTPAGLLRPDRHIVPFTGREAEYATLREWCRDGNSPVRLLVGAGGVGKTRLALQLGDHQRKAGWSVTMVGAGQEERALPASRAATRRSILLIVDYAETRTQLAELLRAVADHPDHVRVLLIARSVGDWWRHLRSDVAAVRDLVAAYPPMTLTAQVDPARPAAELVRAAVPHFAAALKVRPPAKIDVTVPGEVPLLVLHATALVAVLRSQDHLAPTGQLVADLGVLDEMLGHEMRYWEHSAGRAGLSELSPVVLQRAVAVASLFGAADETEGATVLRRVPELRDNEAQRRAVARWLRQLYPAPSGYWGPLQPELLAEKHVVEQLTEHPELLQNLPELRSGQAQQMLTVLSSGATYQPAGLVLLDQALRADLGRLAFPALTVALTTGGALGKVLAEVFTDSALPPPLTWTDIEAKIPYPTTALAGAAVAVTRRILAELPADAELAEVARWQAKLGVVLAQDARPGEALPYTEAAVAHYEALVTATGNSHLPQLARTMHDLGIRYAELGRHEDAVRQVARAVKYYRTLVDHQPDRYRADLAACLNNFGLWLATLGRHDEAVPHFREAVTSFQELVKADPDSHRYRRDLAQALTNQHLSLSKVWQDTEYLRHLETAVDGNRALVDTDRDRYLPDLARSLHNLGNAYAGQARPQDAEGCLAEALSYYRILHRAHPDLHRADFAACLNDVGANLAELDRHDEALPYARDAVELHRQLAEHNTARYQPELARSLDNQVMCLSRLGRHREVLPLAEQAVALHRLLAKIEPQRHRPELARALTNLSVSLTELGRHAAALPAAEEAVTIYRPLYASDPRAYGQRLQRALRNQAVDLSALGRHAEADRCRHEANLIRDEARL